MKITKTDSELGTKDIKLQETEDKFLEILFGGNGDLYWILRTNKEHDSNYETFSITKKDYDLYATFDELYNDIINGRVFIPHIPVELRDEEIKESLDEELKECLEDRMYEDIELCNRCNERMKDNYRHKKLCKNGVITWYSDEEPDNTADVVRIYKREDSYLLEFIRQSKTDDLGMYHYPGSMAIRFRNSGSTYDPFNLVFMRQFNYLQEYEPSSEHQIHIEEYLYEKKLQKLKK